MVFEGYQTNTSTDMRNMTPFSCFVRPEKFHPCLQTCCFWQWWHSFVFPWSDLESGFPRLLMDRPHLPVLFAWVVRITSRIIYTGGWYGVQGVFRRKPPVEGAVFVSTINATVWLLRGRISADLRTARSNSSSNSQLFFVGVQHLDLWAFSRASVPTKMPTVS